MFVVQNHLPIYFHVQNQQSKIICTFLNQLTLQYNDIHFHSLPFPCTGMHYMQHTCEILFIEGMRQKQSLCRLSFITVERAAAGLFVCPVSKLQDSLSSPVHSSQDTKNTNKLEPSLLEKLPLLSLSFFQFPSAFLPSLNRIVILIIILIIITAIQNERFPDHRSDRFGLF